MTFSVYDTLNDYYEVICGYTDVEDTVRDYYNYMKQKVDEYREHPENFE